MSKKVRDYTLFLEDALNALEKIERYTESLTFKKFCENEMVIDAIVRNLEIIGEALKKCSGKGKTQISFCRMERGNWIQKCLNP